jgi:protein-disulfide isomerase
MRVVFAVLALLTLGAAPVDWTKTVTRGPNGAYVLGNPKAKVRLVEYLSYSCSHCADFTLQSSAPIRARYVSKGLVAVELRNAVRDRYDFAAALLARCGGPTRFHVQSEAIFAAQSKLLAQAATHEAGSKLPPGASTTVVLADIAKGSGLTAFMKGRGLSDATIAMCLSNKPSQDIVLAMAKEAWEIRKIGFTPAFLINGNDTGPVTWTTIEPKLVAAIAAR